MKNTFGNQFTITLFGESHGESIGAVMDGLASGIHLDLSMINQMMQKRKAKGNISTQRHESDKIQIVSGYFNGYTTGTPLTILIKNEQNHSKDYEKTKDILRPSHADYTAELKYKGYQDYRGGGHFSGRITAPLVACGAIAMQILNQKGIFIGSHIKQLHHISDISFANDENLLEKQIKEMSQSDFAVLDANIKKQMISHIEETAKQKDSVGGILESAILHVPLGIGEPFFDSIESRLSHLLFSVPAVKGVEFGLGFDFANHHGSEINDEFIYEDHKIKTRTNFNAGINGGISNGMPILLKTVIKPTPSIFKEQHTVNKQTLENTVLSIQGRHDPAIIHRARIVVDSVLAIGILDMIMEHEATLSMNK